MYEIARLEDNETEVFVTIEITDDLGTYNFGHWLTENELRKYRADANSINTTAEKYLINARNNKLAEIAASQIIATQTND